MNEYFAGVQAKSVREKACVVLYRMVCWHVVRTPSWRASQLYEGRGEKKTHFKNIFNVEMLKFLLIVPFHHYKLQPFRENMQNVLLVAYYLELFRGEYFREMMFGPKRLWRQKRKIYIKKIRIMFTDAKSGCVSLHDWIHHAEQGWGDSFSIFHKILKGG